MSYQSFFNAHHSPMGAFASFTLGHPGASGGLGLELAGPANQNMYIGLQKKDGEVFEFMPFFGAASNDKERFDSTADSQQTNRISRFDSSQINRDFRLCTDIWNAGDLTFAIYSPISSIPDPKVSTDDNLKNAIIPAVFVEITVDNSKNDSERRAIFGYQGNDPYSSMRHISVHNHGGMVHGIGQGNITAICTKETDVLTGLAFSIDDLAFYKDKSHLSFGLGNTGACIMTAPAGQIKSWKLAVCFYRGGLVTSGLKTSYLYTKFFHSIEDVASFALDHFSEYKDMAFQANTLLDDSALSDERKFMAAHAIRSYYGSTQLLSVDGTPRWIVNEGEYRMLNTLDLTVDQLFYEIKLNPWTVCNVLDFYTERYSYLDTVRLPGSETEHPGGIGFTHDIGAGNCFSKPGHSVYELPNLTVCFSYMTHEQLVNWILCASVYMAATNDAQWVDVNKDTIESCFISMLNRDHFDPCQRDGIMDLESNRVQNGAEITTYDNVDRSLGRARRNAYLAVKCWAAYLSLEYLFNLCGKTEQASQAQSQAHLCANTICSYKNSDGIIPALLEQGNQSALIPVIEGMAFPWFFNRSSLKMDGPYSSLIQTLKTHCTAVLKSGYCRFEDNGWKLSSTSEKSWLSKIYICQFVAEQILGLPPDILADKAHLAWLIDPQNSYFAWSDQMMNGKVCGSRYYPRGVTSILWLN